MNKDFYSVPIEKCKTYLIEIVLSGPLEIIEQTCRQNFLYNGFCVTVTPTKYIYTGGEETGAIIRAINYPRFTSEKEEIYHRMKELALELLKATCQRSLSIITPEKTIWIAREDLPSK